MVNICHLGMVSYVRVALLFCWASIVVFVLMCSRVKCVSFISKLIYIPRHRPHLWVYFVYLIHTCLVTKFFSDLCRCLLQTGGREKYVILIIMQAYKFFLAIYLFMVAVYIILRITVGIMVYLIFVWFIKSGKVIKNQCCFYFIRENGELNIRINQQ